jgi:ribosomal protein S14
MKKNIQNNINNIIFNYRKRKNNNITYTKNLIIKNNKKKKFIIRLKKKKKFIKRIRKTNLIIKKRTISFIKNNDINNTKKKILLYKHALVLLLKHKRLRRKYKFRARIPKMTQSLGRFIPKDNKKRFKFLKIERKKTLYHSLFHNLELPELLRLYFYEKSKKLISTTVLNNRCLIKGTPRTLRYFKMSRIAFRELALTGKLHSVLKV